VLSERKSETRRNWQRQNASLKDSTAYFRGRTRNLLFPHITSYCTFHHIARCRSPRATYFFAWQISILGIRDTEATHPAYLSRTRHQFLSLLPLHSSSHSTHQHSTEESAQRQHGCSNYVVTSAFCGSVGSLSCNCQLVADTNRGATTDANPTSSITSKRCGTRKAQEADSMGRRCN
jgi:hypothetical protein